MDLGSRLAAEFHSGLVKDVVTECSPLGEEGAGLNKANSRNLFIPSSNRAVQERYHKVPIPWYCHQHLWGIITTAVYVINGVSGERPFIPSLRAFSFLSTLVTNNNSQEVFIQLD